jgi:hypothetical protein
MQYMNLCNFCVLNKFFRLAAKSAAPISLPPSGVRLSADAYPFQIADYVKKPITPPHAFNASCFSMS